jgi:hypothetical protein
LCKTVYVEIYTFFSKTMGINYLKFTTEPRDFTLGGNGTAKSKGVFLQLFISRYNLIRLTMLSTLNSLKTKSRPLHLKTQLVRAVNTFHLGYNNQSVYAVSGTSRCLFSDKYSRPLNLKTQSVPRSKHFSSRL